MQNQKTPLIGGVEKDSFGINRPQSRSRNFSSHEQAGQAEAPDREACGFGYRLSAGTVNPDAEITGVLVAKASDLVLEIEDAVCLRLGGDVGMNCAIVQVERGQRSAVEGVMCFVAEELKQNFGAFYNRAEFILRANSRTVKAVPGPD